MPLLTDDEYAQENGVRCPACGSTMTRQLSQLDMSDETQLIGCRNCLSTWVDLYFMELKGYSDLTLADGTQLGGGRG